MKKYLFKSSVAAIMSAMLFVACVPAGALPAQAAVPDWQKGVSIRPRWNTDFTSDGFKQAVLNAKSMGANYIALIIPYYQSDFWSSDIQNAGNTPSDDTLAASIDYIHSVGLKVSLKPHLEVASGEWRALIRANDRDAWYAKYSALINHLGDIGKAHNVEEIVMGTELIGMASEYYGTDNTARWIKMINSMRTHYSGILTYSANFGTDRTAVVDEFEQIGFWPQLDYIGISAYWSLSSDSNNSVQSLMDSWSRIDQNQIAPLRNKYNKPVLFTEIGYRSVDGAHNYPWDAGVGGGYNAQEQVNDYQALIQYWNSRSYFAGVLLWDWNSDPNYGGQGNTDYTPRNKPAEGTIKQWFAQTGTTPSPTPNPTPTPAPAPTGAWDASSPAVSDAQTGKASNLSVKITTTGQASDVISDIEVYDQTNSKSLQKFFEHQNITQTAPGQYTVSFTPSKAGTYVVKAGVFNNNWSTNYFWKDNVQTFAAYDPGTTPPPNPNPTPTPTPTSTPTTTPPTSTPLTTDIWWPSDGVSITGVQPFKAMVQNKSVSEYSMYWQVDGSWLNQMYDSQTDYPHKEAIVDVTGWSWKGNGPYNINFVSKDGSGTVISQKAVNIYVNK
ncbi:hypothetical protein KW799_01225 [Candidatus Parcubacteria bacterium]|nr:hypothetical protein [Candidatus Parcubacteria bacterium]